MKIAIPIAGGVLSAHFGHCDRFAIMDIDTEKKEIVKTEMLVPPRHEPGVLPSWLSQIGCTVIIAVGMGGRAIDMFSRNGVQVVVGAPVKSPNDLTVDYLNGNLVTGGNLCDEESPHGGGGHCRG